MVFITTLGLHTLGKNWQEESNLLKSDIQKKFNALFALIIQSIEVRSLEAVITGRIGSVTRSGSNGN